MTEFYVIPGAAVKEILVDSQKLVLELVKSAYLSHNQGATVNPDSYFLLLPEKANARVIALPAYLGGSVNKIGIKWIASFPDNIKTGQPRASAVLLLNEYETGYPIACIEAAGISAARTAASAAVATSVLVTLQQAITVAFVGAGVIARTIFEYLIAAGTDFVNVSVYDQDPTSADRLVEYVADRMVPASRNESLTGALKQDVVVFATTAAQPYVSADTPLRAGQVLLNISLRDLAPELLLAANNVLDDTDHCLKANTSPHLAEQLSGSREFVTGTLGALLCGQVSVNPELPTIFSPFGLGVLDIAVGNYVLTEAIDRGLALSIPGFIGETRRW